MVLLRLAVPRWVRDENEKVIKDGSKKIPKRRVRAEDLKDNSIEICRSIGTGGMCDAAREQVGGSNNGGAVGMRDSRYTHASATCPAR